MLQGIARRIPHLAAAALATVLAAGALAGIGAAAPAHAGPVPVADTWTTPPGHHASAQMVSWG